MFSDRTPRQRKLSAWFSQGMRRHPAPGRAACARDWRRQPAPSQRSPGQMWRWGPAVLTDSCHKKPLHGGNALGWQQRWALRARSRFLRPAGPWAWGSALLGSLESQGLSCSPGGGQQAAEREPKEALRQALSSGAARSPLQNANLRWTQVNSHTWLINCSGSPSTRLLLQLLWSVSLNCFTVSLQGCRHSDPGGTELLLRLLRKIQGGGQQDINQPAIQDFYTKCLFTHSMM